VERVILQEDGTLDEEDEETQEEEEVMEVEEEDDSDVRILEDIQKSAEEEVEKETEEDDDDDDEEEEVEEGDLLGASLGKLGKELEESGVDVLTRNQLEILELEMRARAIKAMLKATEQREKGFIGKKKPKK
jgi:hypothetical protein